MKAICANLNVTFVQDLLPLVGVVLWVDYVGHEVPVWYVLVCSRFTKLILPQCQFLLQILQSSWLLLLAKIQLLLSCRKDTRKTPDGDLLDPLMTGFLTVLTNGTVPRAELSKLRDELRKHYFIDLRIHDIFKL